MHTPFINDTTLRAREQTPGVAFTPDEEIEIAHAAAGLPELEVGTPSVGEIEQGQSFDPAEPGLGQRIVIDKHSGSNAVRRAYLAIGIDLGTAGAESILPQIRAFALRCKCPLDISELLHVYAGLGTALEETA
jgi:isopropylmalate/homocitrate/citramalate synthase